MIVHEALTKLRKQVKELDERLAVYEKLGTPEDICLKLGVESGLTGPGGYPDKAPVNEAVVERTEVVEAPFKPRAVRLMESFK